ncbi:MAG: hypothetical protein WBL55_08870, partial [Xanthobacteraceae bacterium]
ALNFKHLVVRALVLRALIAYSSWADTPPARAQRRLPRSEFVNAQKFLAFLALFVRGRRIAARRIAKYWCIGCLCSDAANLTRSGLAAISAGFARTRSKPGLD